MIKIGITGQSGFIGTHLYNYLGLFPDTFERIRFDDSFFLNSPLLSNFAAECDVIVHLAAVNRHASEETLYQTNIQLVKQLINACEKTSTTPHILFSSSIQEEKNTIYGNSKKEGRALFEQWAKKNKAQFTGLLIPNVFGPFGNPYYNSVVATFCHQLSRNETPWVDVDTELKLIYVGELVNEIIAYLKQNISNTRNGGIHLIKIPNTSTITVTELLGLICDYKSTYMDKGEMPFLNNPFQLNLFNTFLCYINHKTFFPFHLQPKSDNRGMFVEVLKLKSGGQISFSTTVTGITRGNHFHTRKTERFAVIKGKARIDFRRVGTDKVFSFQLDGRQPAFVDMPIWHTHNITNIGDEELYTIFWINETYNPSDPDTFFENV